MPKRAGRESRRSCAVAALLLAGAALQSAAAAQAVELADGRVQIHGYGELQLRAISDGFRSDRWYASQWANVLNVETEVDLAPNGLGPFEGIQAFARVQARYDCVWTRMCGLARSQSFFGDRATRLPKNLADGKTSGFSGVIRVGSPQPVNADGRLLPFTAVPPLRDIVALGGETSNFDVTLAPVSDARFGLKQYGGTLGPLILPIGPWHPKTTIVANGALASVPASSRFDFPLRPLVPDTSDDPRAAHGLFVPSQALRERLGDLGAGGLNLSQNELAWNHRASQDERELKEAYLDLELLEGSLSLRVGKQTIVWGKTEIFRGVDQFDPQHLALASLPSLEESRTALWSVRGIYSLYDVGPLQDVRFELAANFDDVEAVEVGTCHEPYSPFLVCGATSALFTHGTLGITIAGIEEPPAPWDSAQGIEVGARLEFRWRRFSFALSDYWGYDDFPYVDSFHEYERKVDLTTGRPLDVNGDLLDPGDPEVRERALALNAANRQFFEVFCSGTVGLATTVFPALSDACLLDLVNDPTPVFDLGAISLTPAVVLSQVLTGTLNGQALLGQIAGLPLGVLPPLVLLNKDPADGGPPAPRPGVATFGANSLATFLTDAEEALLGCGPFYGTDCDIDGPDLFNAEASVLLQAFPQFEPGGPVATRPAASGLVTLPGARGPADPAWTPSQDGCRSPTDPSPDCMRPSTRELIDPRKPSTLPLAERLFPSEMAAVSFNFVQLAAYLGAGSDASCDPEEPLSCLFVTGLFAASGVQRPELRSGGNGRFGRRDFLWHSGAEMAVRFAKRNVLGFALDFAEDATKTNWSLESTWVADQAFFRNDRVRGFGFDDVFNLAISIDRPTFVNFLNANRTFFINTQWFLRWIDDYKDEARFGAHGPLNVLGTLSISTGYFQDRLEPSLTLVHDFNSASGAVLPQMTYRFSASFSATLGVSVFYGGPTRGRIPVRQPVLENNGGDFRPRTRFEGLSALAERDEVSFTVRHTF